MKSLRIHPATFLFLILLALTGFAKLVIPYFFAVILHELGHAIMAKKLGYKLDKIYLLPYGACLSFKDFAFLPEDETKIAIAGPLTNAFLIMLCLCLWWIFPSTYLFTYSFVISNFSIAIFNLLPAYPLDGGRMLLGIMSIKNKRSLALKIVIAFNIIISIIFFIVFLASFFFGINFSFALIAIFLILGVIDCKFQGTYNPLLFETCNNKKNIRDIKSIYVNLNTPIYKILSELNKHKYNLIYVTMPNGKLKVIDENLFQKLFISTTPDKTLKECLKID